MANVVQPLVNPDRGHAPQGGPSSARVALVRDVPPDSVSDSGQGQALFVLFTTAVLIVTGAVAFLALFSSWWVLGVVFGVHVLVTVVVGAAVFAVLGNGKLRKAGEDIARLEAVTDPERADRSRSAPDQAARVAA